MAPTIYDRSESGLVSADSYKFGALGDIDYLTIHHSAGAGAGCEGDYGVDPGYAPRGPELPPSPALIP